MRFEKNTVNLSSSIFILTIHFLTACSTTPSQNKIEAGSLVKSLKNANLNGTYVGLEEICYVLKDGTKECYTDEANPKRKWYHLTYIKIKGDSVFVDQSPINIYKKETIYSASDGAFYYYRGKMKDSVINVELSYCDYCGIPAENSPNAYLFPNTKRYPFTSTTGGLLINGYLFKRTDSKEQLMSERPARG
jgi:hypothetical protein